MRETAKAEGRDHHSASFVATQGLIHVSGARPGAGRIRDIVVLVGSLAVIATAALLLTVLCIGCLYGALVLWLGSAETTQLLYDLQFNVPLRTRLNALAVSLLYVSLAIASLCTAMVISRSGWRRRLALGPSVGRSRLAITIGAATVSYGALVALAIEHMKARHLIVSGPTDYTLIATVVLNLVVLAPLAEELFFRGWLYTGLRARMSVVPSFLGTTALFAAIHWDANHRRILFVLPLAIALGILREVTGSVRPTMLLHALYNLAIVAVTLSQT